MRRPPSVVRIGLLARALTGLLALVVVASPTTHAADAERTQRAHGPPNRLTCRGYSQARVFLEGQAWWTRAGIPAGRRSEHVHVATCFPWRQTISGVVRFDVRVKLHAMRPGARLRRTRIVAYNESDTTLWTIDWRNYRCRAADCTVWRTVYADTRRSPYGGRQEFRFLTKVVRPDGKEIVVTTRWQAYLDNGKPVRHYRLSDNYIGGAGWYTNRGYQTALLSSGIPRAPISGVWRPSVRLTHGSDGLPSTGHLVSVDSDFHVGRAGRVVRRAAGEHEGSVEIDTSNLANGIHRLFLRVDEGGRGGTGGTVSGAFAIPFTVRN
jgi:hypothetical protein